MRISKLADKIFPYIDRCVVCSVEKDVEGGLCKKCAANMKQLEHGASQINGYTAWCAYEYKDEAGKLVRSFKYNDARYLSRFMAQCMVEGLNTQYSYVTHVPLHVKRRKHRGYDQAELLAKQLADISGVPYAQALVRTRNTKTQTRLDAQQRKQNMSGAFECMQRLSGRIALVDDVLTTGATAAECAKVLKENGVEDVMILTFARAASSGEKQTVLARLLKKIF